MLALQQSFGGQPLIHAKDRVLVDREFLGQLSHTGKTVSGGQSSTGTMGADLIGNLPGDGHAGGCFDADEHKSR